MVLRFWLNGADLEAAVLPNSIGHEGFVALMERMEGVLDEFAMPVLGFDDSPVVVCEPEWRTWLCDRIMVGFIGTFAGG